MNFNRKLKDIDMKIIVPLLISCLALPLWADYSAPMQRKSPYKEKIDSAGVDGVNKITFTYDEHGNNTLKTYSYIISDVMTPMSKFYYTYDNKNRLSGEWMMSYSEGKWIGQSDKDEYTYNSDNKILWETSSTWDETTDSWKLSYKSNYTYTSFDSVETELF